MNEGRRAWLRWLLGALGLTWLDACGMSDGERSAGGDGRGRAAKSARVSGHHRLRSLPAGARLVLLLGPWPEAAWPEAAGFAVRFVDAGMVPRSSIDVAALAREVDRRMRSGSLELARFSDAEKTFLRELLVSLCRTPRASAALLGQPMPGCPAGGR